MIIKLRYSQLFSMLSKLPKNWQKDVAPLPVPGRYAAFTLIELSIVLVIIGLIAGGILFGQDLIEAADNRAIIAEIQKLDMTAMTYKSRYNELLSDMPEAKSRQLFGDSFCAPNGFACRGDKNRAISSGGSGTLGAYEARGSWWHMGKVESFPYIIDYSSGYGGSSLSSYGSGLSSTTKKGLGWGISYSHIASNWANHLVSNKVFLPGQVKQLDDKMDNGHPATGKLKGTGAYSDGLACLTNGAAHHNTPYSQVANADYDITQMDKSCVLYYDLGLK